MSADSVITLMILIIIIVAAAIPVTLQVIANVTLTGTTAIVVNLIPLFLGLAALVVTARAMKGG